MYYRYWLGARQNVLTKLGTRPGALNDLAMIFTTAHGQTRVIFLCGNRGLASVGVLYCRETSES
jgi:hypothetical protein